MKTLLFVLGIFTFYNINLGRAVDVRLLDLEPNDAQQRIDQHDTTLKYAPKIETNVPAVRFLGNEPHNVLEDIYLANQYHGQDGLGGYLYGYSVPDIAKTERKKAGGDLRGAYNYIAGNGQEIKVEYWDDGTGFHQIDNVPKVLPQQIDDTPEVKAAKEEHARLWQEQAIRNSKPVESPYNSEGQYAQGPLSVQGQQQQQQQLQYSQSQQFNQQRQFGGQQQYQQPKLGQQQAYQQPQQYQAAQSQNYPQQQKPFQQQQPQQYQAAPSQINQQQQKPFQQQQPQQYQTAQTQTYSQQQPQQQPQQPKTQQTQYQAQPTQQQAQYTQQQKQFSGSNVQYQSDQYYSGQQTQQSPNQYQKSEDLQADGEDDGSYKPSKEELEEQGPPRGFFYNFDYPVGIIVSKEGAAQGGGIQKRSDDLLNVFQTNKAMFMKQLRGEQVPAGSANGYHYIKN